MIKTKKIRIFDSKKAMDVSPLSVVVAAAILLVVIVVVITMFIRLFGKETAQIEEKIDELADTDDDGIINLFDKCPCRDGEKDNDGCPFGTEPPKTKEEKEIEIKYCKDE